MISALRALWWRLRTGARADRLEQEMRDELEFHREMLERDFRQAGVAPDAAGPRSRRRLGNQTWLTEESRMHWGFPTLETLLNDVRYAARSLRGSATYTLAATLTLALGIGAAVAIFSIVDAILLRALPYRDGNALVSLYSTPPGQSAPLPFSYPDFRDVRARNRVFTDVVFARGEAVRVRGEMGAENVLVAFVTDGLFPMLGTAPLLGRTFAADEERAGATPTIVLGYHAWMERFGGDSSILNRPIATLNGTFTVIGVMPPAFDWPEWAEAWSPLAVSPFPPDALERRGFRVDARTLARVSPGVSADRVRDEMETIGGQLAAEYPAEDGELTMRAARLRDELVGPVRRPLIVLLSAVAGLLLIACANVANLSLARASSRGREIGVRLALGASRGRVARQLLAEGALLALLGGVLGTALAYAGLRWLLTLAPPDLPRLAEVALNGRVLLFALAACGASVLLFGLAPALAASVSSLAQAVGHGGRGTASPRRARLQSAFVVAEIAIACALVAGSGLLVKSFARMRGAHPGFDPERLVSLRIEPLESRYDTPGERLALYNEIRDAVARIPGVERVTYINHSPASRSGVFTALESDGDPRPNGRPPGAAYRLVDSAYFRTIGQRVLRGRGFGAADMTPNATSVVVNETLARTLWGTADPLGHRIVVFKQLGAGDFNARVEGRVVGVVEDIKDYDLGRDAWAEVYLPFTVNPWRSMYLAIRTSGDPAAVVPAVQRVVSAIDADLPVRRTRTVDQLFAERLARRSFNAAIVTVFGSVALLLAAFGVYGVVAYGVAQRTREIGIRAALGARPEWLVRMFVGRATRLASVGVVIGVGLALLLGRAMATMLFGLAPADPATLLQVTVTVVALAAAASWVPARRALRVDPSITLRGD